MASTAWSTQQLAEFVAAVSAATTEPAAALAAVERAAEALDAEMVAIVGGGQVFAAIGYADGTTPVDALEAVQPGVVDSSLEVPGVGTCTAAAVPLEHPPGSTLVVARSGPDSLTREERSLLRGMARVASLTMWTQRLLDEERAAREELEQLAREQAALRRVASLVARGEPPSTVFAAVAEEVGKLVADADFVLVSRYDGGAAGEVVGSWARSADHPRVGLRFPLGGGNLHTLVFETKRAARVDQLTDAAAATTIARELGARSSAGAPITVAGGLWGVIVVASRQAAGLPEDVEQRLAEFTELVATAIANSQAREELSVFADWQAAVRRVAVRVARGEPPDAIFAAVAEEVGPLFNVDAAGVVRYDNDAAVTAVGSWNTLGDPVTGERRPIGGENVTALVYETGRPARIDSYPADDPSDATALARRAGARSAVAAPIRIEGSLWGALQVASSREHAIPAATEGRLAAFADLVATALANAQAREELRRVADEQAALRRVATLVALPASPAEVFAAVTDEVGRLLSADVTGLVRFDPDNAATLVAARDVTGAALPTGVPGPLEGRTVTALVRETGRPARFDDYAAEADPGGSLPTFGVRSAVAVPITVEGRLWGAISVGMLGDEPPPPDTETRLVHFTELVATAVANAQSRAELEDSRVTSRRVAEEQAALRRVATLVAGATPPTEVFAAVAKEVGRLVETDRAFVSRYEPDDAVMILAGWTKSGEALPVHVRFPIQEYSVSNLVRKTGRVVRIDAYPDGGASPVGNRAAVGAPITVEGRLWGLMTVGSMSGEPSPPGTEERLTNFTELVATAIANAQAREELRTVADDQAALRRVATLVARGTPAGEILDTVTEEVHRLLHADQTGLSRYDPDGLWTVLAVRGALTDLIPVGFRLDPGASMPGVAELLSGRSVRVDAPPEETALDDVISAEHMQAWVASPIVLRGRTWGQVAVFSRHGPLSAGTEERLADFTELAATAIANAEAQAELTASRARIVATADETRRRIERDLHDGAQQRLVTLALQLRAAQAAVPRDLHGLIGELDEVALGLGGVLEELREFARGIHPAILADGGLGSALKGLGRRSPIPVDLELRVDGRLPEPVEVGAYYVVSEALANTAKHAEASVISVNVTAADGVLRVRVRDDGVGGATFARGSGLVGLKDRVEALGGRISVESPRRQGTSIQVELPLTHGAE